jgi:hypothetical protein
MDARASGSAAPLSAKQRFLGSAALNGGDYGRISFDSSDEVSGNPRGEACPLMTTLQESVRAASAKQNAYRSVRSRDPAAVTVRNPLADTPEAMRRAPGLRPLRESVRAASAKQTPTARVKTPGLATALR